MANPKRREADPAHSPSSGPSAPDVSDGYGGYRPGGPIGQMQADLTQRLAREGFVGVPAGVPMIESPGEQMLRSASTMGGYLALLAGYGVVIGLILR